MESLQAVAVQIIDDCLDSPVSYTHLDVYKRQVQSRVKMLEKLELIEVDEEDTSRLRLKFPPSPRSGAYPVQMSDVAMSFDGKKIFSGVNLTCLLYTSRCV